MVVPPLSVYSAGGWAAGPLLHEAIRSYNALGLSDARLVHEPMASEQALCRLLNWSDVCALGAEEATPHIVHWVGLDSEVTDEQHAAHPDLQMYPIAATAVVPIYHLPNATSSDPPLVLSRGVLADVFRSVITRWDDERIAAENPALVALGRLPAADILVVVQSDNSSTTETFRRALTAFDMDGFGRQVGVSPGPEWGNSSVYRCNSASFGPAPCVMATPQAIGYAPLSVVQDLGLAAVSILHPASNTPVAASTHSVWNALSEGGNSSGIPLDGPARLSMDITNAQEAMSWPIAGLVYMAMRKHSSGPVSECDGRREAVLFWRWFYTTRIVGRIADRLGYVWLTEHIRLLVLQRFKADVKCNGARVYTRADTIEGGGVEWLASDLRRLALSYAGGIATYQAVGDLQGFQRLTEGGTEYAVSSEDMMSAVNGSLDEFAAVPFRGIGLAAIFSFCDGVLADTCVLSDRTLVLDIDVLVAVMNGTLTRWLDPRIVSLNPWMSLELYATAIGSDREIALIGEVPSSGASQLLVHLLRRYRPYASLSALETVGGRAIFETTSSRVAARIAAMAFSLAIVPYSNVVAGMHVASIASDALTSAVMPSLATIGACVCARPRIGGPHAFQADGVCPSNEASPTLCYPLSTSLVLATKRHYDGAQCAFGESRYRFFRWLLDAESKTPATRTLSLAAYTPRRVERELSSLTCDGTSFADALIDTKPLNVYATSATIFVGIFLIFFLVASGGFFFVHRRTSAVKTGQLHFLGLTSCGCIFLLVAMCLAPLDQQGRAPVESVPVGEPGRYPLLDVACGSQVWLYFIGSSLTYTPLTFKLWRVKRLLINPAMRTVRSRVRHYLLWVVALHLADVLLLVAWSAVAPPFYRVEVFISDAPTRAETWHGSCEILPHGSQPFAVALLLKQLGTVLFGLYLCSGTRHLSETYSDGPAMSFVLSSYIERTLTAFLLCLFLYPFTSSGSPMAFFLLKVFVMAGDVITTAVFIFVWRLAKLWDELRQQKMEKLRQSPELIARRPSMLRFSRSLSSSSITSGLSPPRRVAPSSVLGKGTLSHIQLSQVGSSTASTPAIRAALVLDSDNVPESLPPPLSTHASPTSEARGSIGISRLRAAGHAVLAVNEMRSTMMVESLKALGAELDEARDEIAELREDNSELRNRNFDLLQQLAAARDEHVPLPSTSRGMPTPLNVRRSISNMAKSLSSRMSGRSVSEYEKEADRSQFASERQIGRSRHVSMRQIGRSQRESGR